MLGVKCIPECVPKAARDFPMSLHRKPKELMYAFLKARMLALDSARGEGNRRTRGKPPILDGRPLPATCPDPDLNPDRRCDKRVRYLLHYLFFCSTPNSTPKTLTDKRHGAYCMFEVERVQNSFACKQGLL